MHGLLALVLAISLSGCLSGPQQGYLQRDLDEVKRRLAYLERRVTSESLDLKGDTVRNLTTVIKKQADTQADMDNLRVELQTLKGRLEELSRQVDRQGEELALLRDQLVLKTSDLEGRLKKTTDEAASFDAASLPSGALVPEEIYKQALRQVREKGDFAGGRQTFQRFLLASPNHPLAPNAMYWVGETYYGDKDYENAIVQFQEILQKHPQHPKAASALLKQGLAFHALGDDKSALILFQKVVTSFPASEEADLARKKTAELKTR